MRQRGKLALYEKGRQLCDLSRHYNKNKGIVGGKVTKRVRYLLLSDDYEADISSYSNAIITAFAGEFHSPLIGNTKELRQYITDNIYTPCPDPIIAKTIMQLIITADPTSVVHLIQKKFSATMSLELSLQMRRFFEARGGFVRNMNNAGFYGCDDRLDIPDPTCYISHVKLLKPE